MTHNTTVPTETFARLNEWQRHLVIKHNTLMIPGDIIVCNEQDTRNQLEFEIKSIEPLHSRSDLVGMYAPYKDTVVSLTDVHFNGKNPVDDIPDTVG